jgi:Asp-tRNA(Asn)/Glu-tRNA(Gln) amidotransferase A subunit family amidase
MLVSLLVFCSPLLRPQAAEPALQRADLQVAARVVGLTFSDAEAELALAGVRENLESYERLWGIELDNSVAPVLSLSAAMQSTVARLPRRPALEPAARALPEARRPADLEQLAFASVETLAALVKSRQVSCVELAELSLARLERLDPALRCVVTLLPERARAQAQALDAELEQGKWRGPLHGIPWGAKDLLAVRGAPTTWGAEPYVDQVLDYDAEVVRRLDAAGAVLVAKLSLGALAWGDVWFGGTTRNPWKPEQGSSGSSAGPASAVAAGCVAFAIGSETCGSILSPSARCGNSSLRPTFGRVGRHGAMALSWSMDKLGPMCRTLDDAALVFGAIAHRDARDEESVDVPWSDPGPADVSGLRVGFTPGSLGGGDAELALLAELESVGCEIVEVTLPDLPSGDLFFVLSAEAATAFDALTRSGADDELARQVADAWPNVFRQARLIPAVEYLRAQRLRRGLIEQVERVFTEVDVLVHGPTDHVVTFNLTGHPSAIAPWTLREDGTPRAVAFTAGLYEDARVLAVAAAWQRATAYHHAHPEL